MADCPSCTDVLCIYEANCSLTWPTKPPCASKLWPWNHETPDGRFFMTDVEGGDVWVYGSDFTIPAYSVTTQVTSTQDTLRPAIAEDFRRRLHLVYTRLIAGVKSVYRRFSDDDANSFSTETALGITNGHYATVATSPDGDLIIPALVYNAGTSGPGKIWFEYQGPGDAALSTPAKFKDDASADLVVQDTTFHISFAAHGARALVLSCLIDGETDTSTWQCWDFDNAGNATFKRV